MDSARGFLIAKLAQTDERLAPERRHIAELAVQLEKAGSLAWAQGIEQVQSLLALSQERIARLDQQRDDLIIAIGSEPDRNSN